MDGNKERELQLEELVRDFDYLLGMLVYDNEPIDDIAGEYGRLQERMEALGIDS